MKLHFSYSASVNLLNLTPSSIIQTFIPSFLSSDALTYRSELRVLL